MARRSWLGALLVLAAGAAGVAASFLFGIIDPAVVLACGAVASGATLIAWSLLRRSRRIPGVALALVLLLSIAAAGLSAASVTPMSYSTQETSSSQREFDYVNVPGADLDLTGHESGTVTINAVLSDVSIIIPEGATVEVTQFGSTVDIPPPTTRLGNDLRVEINAVRSTVTGTRS